MIQHILSANLCTLTRELIIIGPEVGIPHLGSVLKVRPNEGKVQLL